ncbi:unnamed protein product [Parajaminaea phylloscopi]
MRTVRASRTPSRGLLSVLGHYLVVSAVTLLALLLLSATATPALAQQQFSATCYSDSSCTSGATALHSTIKGPNGISSPCKSIKAPQPISACVDNTCSSCPASTARPTDCASAGSSSFACWKSNT